MSHISILVIEERASLALIWCITIITSIMTTNFLFCGYIIRRVAFAKKLEPDNPHIERYLKKYDSAHVHSTLDEESRINPFLRFNDKKIISVLEKKGLPVGTEFERWESLMSLM